LLDAIFGRNQMKNTVIIPAVVAVFDQRGGAGATQRRPGNPCTHRRSCVAGHAVSYGDASRNAIDRIMASACACVRQ
jgi:hypothetical protein